MEGVLEAGEVPKHLQSTEGSIEEVMEPLISQIWPGVYPTWLQQHNCDSAREKALKKKKKYIENFVFVYIYIYILDIKENQWERAEALPTSSWMV